MSSLRDQALAARAASRVLRTASTEKRTALLRGIAKALVDNSDRILAANDLDVEQNKATLAPSSLQRLYLKRDKLRVLAEGIEQIASQPEPIGKVLKRTLVADGLVLEQQSSPLGVLLVIFESRPDALPQVASLALRSGNGIMLKGGKEALYTNRVLHAIISEQVAAAGIDPAVVTFIERREEIASLLALDDVIDLVIPRGSGELVRHIQSNTRIPVLGHAEGICHVYVDSAVDMDLASKVVVDAKTDYPAACNAMETLLIHKDLVADGRAASLIATLRQHGVEVFGGPRAHAAFALPLASDLHHEYSALGATVEVVDGIQQAIDHIHRYGSGHTESILTSDDAVAKTFLDQVDSACVFHNASTRFADGYRMGLGAEVGISTSRIHARGPVGIEGLMTTRWIMKGHGDIVKDFSNGTRSFSHIPL